MEQEGAVAEQRPIEEDPLDLSTPRFRLLRRMIRPLRRLTAWFSLVYEERYWRVNADRDLQVAVEEAREAKAIADWTSQELSSMEHRLIERGDLIAEELWRRSEVAVAAQARDVQRLQEEVTRLVRENTALLRLLAEESTTAAGVAVPAAVSAIAATAAVTASEARASAPAQTAAPATAQQRSVQEGDGAGNGHVAASIETLVSGNGKTVDLTGNGDGQNRSVRRPRFDDLVEELERGSRQEVMDKAHRYLQFFRGGGPIVDLGCGRGEMLELLTWAGMEAYGVDLDAVAVERCRELGLDARAEDLYDHLRSLPDESLGGVFCAQVVEHLPPETLNGLCREIARVLRPGSRVVVETPNPGTFATHMHSFWRDPTHIRPVPQPTLAMSARAAGLIVEDTLYASPPPDEERLQPTNAEAFDPPLRDLARAFNHTVDQLNEVLYGNQDYALIAIKPR
jgi:SAM-dependent methyltransferase